MVHVSAADQVTLASASPKPAARIDPHPRPARGTEAVTAEQIGHRLARRATQHLGPRVQAILHRLPQRGRDRLGIDDVAAINRRPATVLPLDWRPVAEHSIVAQDAPHGGGTPRIAVGVEYALLQQRVRDLANRPVRQGFLKHPLHRPRVGVEGVDRLATAARSDLAIDPKRRDAVGDHQDTLVRLRAAPGVLCLGVLRQALRVLVGGPDVGVEPVALAPVDGVLVVEFELVAVLGLAAHQQDDPSADDHLQHGVDVEGAFARKPVHSLHDQHRARRDVPSLDGRQKASQLAFQAMVALARRLGPVLQRAIEKQPEFGNGALGVDALPLDAVPVLLESGAEAQIRDRAPPTDVFKRQRACAVPLDRQDDAHGLILTSAGLVVEILVA